MNQPINLIDAQFQHSNLFNRLPIFDAIYYQGHPDGKIQRYKAVREEQSCMLLALTIIRKEEDILWAACEDLLNRCVIEGAARMQGIYSFDLLTFDIHKEINTFNYTEFSLLIANASRKIQPGEQRLVRYSSAYGLLQKMVVESWGKITLKTSVDIFKDEPSFLYVPVKRLFKIAQIPNDPLIILITDLSTQPLFDPSNQKQQDFLKKLMDEKAQETIEFLPEVYIQDKNGVRELMSGTMV